MSFYKLISSRYFSRYLKPFLLVTDLLILNSVYFGSLLIRYGDFSICFRLDCRVLLLLSNITWIILTLFRDEYKLIRIERFEVVLGRSIRLVLLHLSIIALSILILDYEEVSRLRIFNFYLLLFFFVFLYRYLFIEALKRARKKGYNNRNVVIFGVSDLSEKLNQFISSDLSFGFQVLGFFSLNKRDETNITSPYLGSVSQFESYSQNQRIDEVYISLSETDSEIISKLITICDNNMIRIKFIPDFHRYTKTKRIVIDFYNKIPILMFRKEPLQLARNRILKRIFDLIFSSLALLVLIPLVFPIIILAIKINSRGPIFFIQKRSGEDNSDFNCLKFRTMSVNNNPDQQATKNDSRITGVGAFLRKTSLDELPQFINVFIGNMSVVGPRPHPLYMTEEYKMLVKSYLIRHLAKPGITGLAQVSGYRGETDKLIDMEKRVEYDINYIENWGFLLDLKIIWKTIYNIVKGEENVY